MADRSVVSAGARPAAGSGQDRITPILGWVAFVVVLFAMYLVFLWVPNERTMGVVSRIMYFHIASAWNAFLAFGVVFFGSIAYLITRNRRWDSLAGASAEIGVLFTTLVLTTGPIWARPVWNVWWTWDPRLTTTLVLWFLYLAYLVLRSAVEGDERKARFAAVFGIIAFIDVPIVWLSVQWWRTIHPQVFQPGEIGLAPQMLQTLIVSVVAFTLLYAYFMRLLVRLYDLQGRVSEMKDQLRLG